MNIFKSNTSSIFSLHPSTHSYQATCNPSPSPALRRLPLRRPELRLLWLTPAHQTPCVTLLLSLAEVVTEVKVARGVGHGRGSVWDRHVLQVQEAQLDLHGEEDLQLTAHALTAHVPAQQHAQPVRPQAELRDTQNISSSTGTSYLLGEIKCYTQWNESQLTSVLDEAMKFRLYSSTSYVMVNARSSTSYQEMEHSRIRRYYKE